MLGTINSADERLDNLLYSFLLSDSLLYCFLEDKSVNSLLVQKSFVPVFAFCITDTRYLDSRIIKMAIILGSFTSLSVKCINYQPDNMLYSFIICSDLIILSKAVLNYIRYQPIDANDVGNGQNL